MEKAKNLFGEEESTIHTESDLSVFGKKLAADFDAMSVAALKLVYHASTGKVVDPKWRKHDLCVATADVLDFKNQTGFDDFFGNLPPLTQEAITVGAFYRYVPVPPLEKKYGSPVLHEKRSPFYENEIVLNERLRLDYFVPVDPETIYLPSLFRIVFARWLPPPPERSPVPISDPEGQVWSNVEFIREAAPLMGRLAAEAPGDRYKEEFARKGLSKTESRKYRAAFGQAEFPMAGKYGLDSVDLFTRIAACVSPLTNKQVRNGDEYLKAATQAFLNPGGKSSGYARFNGTMLEYLVLIDHLSRRQGYYMDVSNAVPPSRGVLKRLLGEIGKTVSWYATADLYRALVIRDEPFFFIEANEERKGLFLKCTSLTVNGFCFSEKDYEYEIPMTGRIREVAVGLPLLKAYCYVLALLGVVEIAEAEPEMSVEKKGKKIPVSPYDAAAYVRVTEFGAWCLGLKDEKPRAAEHSFEAIADRELLLVTFRGKSIERKLYLENIGDKLGAERYRVTEASFIRGCKSKNEIDSRIETFKRIIEADPSPRWVEFFKSVRERAGLFSEGKRAMLFSLPKDPALARAIVSDPLLRPFITRAEGGKIAVLAAVERKFRKALLEAGYFNEE